MPTFDRFEAKQIISPSLGPTLFWPLLGGTKRASPDRVQQLETEKAETARLRDRVQHLGKCSPKLVQPQSHRSEKEKNRSGFSETPLRVVAQGPRISDVHASTSQWTSFAEAPKYREADGLIRTPVQARGTKERNYLSFVRVKPEINIRTRTFLGYAILAPSPTKFSIPCRIYSTP